LGLTRPSGSLFRSLTDAIDPRARSLSPPTRSLSMQMRLQVLAILENGASKVLPKASDTLRVLLILPDPQGTAKPGAQIRPGAQPASPVRRRILASLASGS
jgi:hypothetical protein